jgi:hypothetical protein
MSNTETQQLKMFVIDDGGETWWWAAPSKERAREMHVELNYTKAGVPLTDSDISDCGVYPDDKVLTLCDTDPHVSKTAREWCEQEGEGLVGCTAF